MQASKRCQCHVCGRWFCHRGISQHINKQRHCRDVIMSSHRAAMQLPLRTTRTLPVSTTASSESLNREDDHARRGHLSYAEIAVTRDNAPDISSSSTDPADIADAIAYEEPMRYRPTTINPDQMTVGEAPELTEEEDQNEFPFESPGMPIPDNPQGSSEYESRGATSMDSPWAPLCSELDLKVALWVKRHASGPGSTAVRDFLAIPGVVEDLGLSFRTVEELDEMINSNFLASGHRRLECKKVLKKRVRSNSAQMFPHVAPANEKKPRRVRE